MTIREALEKKKAAQAAAGQAAARSGETVAPNNRQSVGGIKVPLAAIFAALAAFGKKPAEKLRQKRKDNDGRSQTPEESASRLISKKFLHSFWESVFSIFAMRNKFHFSGIAAVVTAVRQWIFGKSKAGADGGGFGLASEPEEQGETGGSRIALLILIASLTTLALWAQCWDDKGTYTCISAFSGCKPRTGTSGFLWTSWGENKQSQCRSVSPSDESEDDCNDEPIGCLIWVNYVVYSGKKCTGPITLSGGGWFGLMGTHAVLSGVPCIGDNY